MTADLDRQLMARAIVLADHGRATARPNPAVGCVVARDREIVGEGWHAVAGGPHAEVVALSAAGERAEGATAYVSLEPCDHVGRTGPCTGALLDAGIARVVYALGDPVNGGAATLATAGVAVEGGLLGAWAAAQNEAFLHSVRTGRPFVTLKLAQTLDGRLSIPGSGWLTGEEARTQVHRQRRDHDAILVGSQTVLDDDPRLDVRHVAAGDRQPRPVVLDARGRIPPAAVVVQRGALVFTTDASDDGWRRDLAEGGAEVVTVPEGERGGVDLAAVLADLTGREVRSLYVEGGGTVATSLVRERLVDRLILHVALGVIGPGGLPAAPSCVTPPRGSGWAWRTEAARHLGADMELVATPVEEA